MVSPNVDSSENFDWAGVPHRTHPSQHSIYQNHQQFQPRRSISTVTGPSRREVNAFYQQNFANKQNGNSIHGSSEYSQQRPSIMSGLSNQSHHLQTSKDQVSFDPIRFSPPNVTPPPSFPSNQLNPQRNRVRFDDLSTTPQPKYLDNPIVPRKASLAPNFFSSKISRIPEADRYSQNQRGWQNTDFISTPLQLQQSSYLPPDWSTQPPSRKVSSNMMGNVNHLEVKVENTTDRRYIPNHSHDMMDINNTLKHSNNTEMLSPIKMEIDPYTTDHQQVSPYSLLMPNVQNTSGNQQSHHKRSHPMVPSRKASIMALKSQLRTPRGCPSQSSISNSGGIPYTPPPILAPMRNGSGLFCSIAKTITAQQSSEISDVPSCSTGINLDENDTMLNGKKKSEDGDGPSRKNGFFYMAQQINQPNFADELEALRKESWASTSSVEEKAQITRKKSIDPEVLRKVSMMSDCYYDLPTTDGPHISDPNPHINIGREYQARVRKWNDREVHRSELDAIEDRDEIVFSSDVLQDIDQEQISAFELLACSQACPRAGRNKELAMHLLMENKGNIEAAVEDLLRSDTLDWEQYTNIFGHLYNDCVMWTPDEVFQFQDAIYKSEKDFDKVAQELPGKTVRECVQFYYTWKKACPDDYRKLRNLRRKRQLLEMNLQVMQLEEVPVPIKKCSLQESIESDAESNATEGSYSTTGAPNDFRDRAFTSPLMSSPRESPLIGMSPGTKELYGLQKNYQPTTPRHQPVHGSVANKKGAQPSADGFFHCRLCDKCFEKVKSLNAHMKSHAMKARAEQEAKAHDAQMAAAAVQLSNAVNNANTSSPMNPFSNNPLGISIPSSIASLTPQQLTPQQLNLNLNQHLQSQLSSLTSQLNSQLNSPLTPQQQLHQLTQQQLVARAMQQNLFQPPQSGASLNGIAQPHAQHPLLQAGLHTIH